MFYTKWSTQRAIARWRHALNLDQHQTSFHRIFESADGFYLSRQARANMDAIEYVYGEIDFESFIAILSLANINASTIFYDLGSGIGTAVIACAMVFNVKKSIGIEKFSVLYSSANQQLKKLKQHANYSNTGKKVSFINDDFLLTNLDDASLIFINATGLFGVTWAKLNQRLDELPNSPEIITTSKKLLAVNYHLAHTTKAKMSWGVVDVYYYLPFSRT